MLLKHIEYMICGSKNHLFALGKNDCLQNVYHLSNVSHLYSVRVEVEQVQIDGGKYSISH